MAEDLLSKLKGLEQKLLFERDKATSYAKQVKSNEVDFCIVSGKIQGYDNSIALLYQYFPELRSEGA